MAVVKAVLRTIVAVFKTAWAVLKAVTAAVWGAIKAIIMAVWNVIGPYVKRAVENIKAVITAVWNAIKSVTSTIWNGLKKIVSKAIDGVVDLAKGIKDRILSPLKYAGKWLYNKGKEIIMGLIDGIGAMIGKLKDKVNSVTDTIGKFLPGSPVREGPLKVLNKGYAGKQIVRMFMDGIEDMAPALEQTVNNVMAVPPLEADLSRLMPATAPVHLPALVGAGVGSSHARGPAGPAEVNNHFDIHNPVPETASKSVKRAISERVEEEGWR
jgi:phage-related protein